MEKWLPRRQFWAACAQPARASCRLHTRERHSGAGDQSAARVGGLEDDRLGAGGRSEVAAGGGGCRRVLVVEQHDDLRGRRDRAACDTAGVGLCAAQPVAGDAERDRLPAQRLAGAGQRCAGSNARAGGANTATLPHPQRTVHDRSQGNFLPTQARSTDRDALSLWLDESDSGRSRGRPRLHVVHLGFRAGYTGVVDCPVFRRPVASAMPLSAADRQHLGDRRFPRPSTRCSRIPL
jgi:hypothetical protein